MLLVGTGLIDDSFWNPTASREDSPHTDCAVSEIKPSGFWWMPVDCDEKTWIYM